MQETHSAGIKEFFLSVIWMIIIFLLGESTSYALPVYKVISGLLTMIFTVIFVFFVLTRYSAVFTYSLNSSSIRVNRKIGRRRNKEIEIKLNYVCEITKTDPKIKPTYRMKQYILRNKRDWYVVFINDDKRCCLLFTPSDEMLKKLKKTVKKSEKGARI